MIDGVPTCPECGSSNIEHDSFRAEVSCSRCGEVILESMIDEGQEWRAFDADQRQEKARAGGPLSFTKPNRGLSTHIDQFNRDDSGKSLPAYTRNQMYRLRSWHKRASTSTSMERNLKTALHELKRIISTLRLPHAVAEETAMIYRQAVRKGLIRGRLIEEVLTSCLYITCRKRRIPRTLDELAEVSGIDKKDIGRTYRFLKDELDIEVPLSNPVDYIPRFASQLDLNGKVQEEAKRILEEALHMGLISGRGPTGVAAAALYISSVTLGEKRTQKQVAEAAGVTEVTIRNRYAELKEEMNLTVNA